MTELEEAAKAWREADEALWNAQAEKSKLEFLLDKVREDLINLRTEANRAEGRLRAAARGFSEDSQV